MPSMRPLPSVALPFVAFLFGALLLSACTGGGSLTGDPALADDDDDATSAPDEPLEGEWAGPVDGLIVYGGRGSYPCSGVGEATVDDTDRATGSMDCHFDHTDETCTYTFEDLLIGGGQRPSSIDDCFGAGEATHSMWDFEGRIFGRVQRLDATVSLEFSWALEPTRD